MLELDPNKNIDSAKYQRSCAAVFFGVTFILVAFIFSFYSKYLNLEPEESIGIARMISGSKYKLPESFELVYAKRHGKLFSSNYCFVFNYPEGFYTIYNSKFNYLNQRKDYSDLDFDYHHFKNEVSKKQGCYQYISKLNQNNASLFKEYDFYSEYGRGSKIFIKERDNLIMFEGYWYD
ncbi:MAG: hypothetical protein AAFQ14_15160 [Cyanobacteria bacterium J06621_12]